jgi:hypothetical protein
MVTEPLTKTANQVTDRICRCCSRISGPGHQLAVASSSVGRTPGRAPGPHAPAALTVAMAAVIVTTARYPASGRSGSR